MCIMWNWIELSAAVPHQSLPAQKKERLHSLLFRTNLVFRSIASFLFAFHYYITHVSTAFAKKFNSSSLTD